MSYEIQIQDTSLRRMLQALQQRFGAIPPAVLEEIAETIVSSIKRNFTEGGRYSTPNDWRGGTNKWKPSKRAMSQGGQTLLDTGRLRSSIWGRATQGGVLIGSNLPQARILHEGGTIQHPGGTPYITTRAGAKFLRKDGNYPKGTRFTRPHTIRIEPRPIFVVQQKDIEEIVRLIASHLQ
jgi:phage gpG-like protein